MYKSIMRQIKLQDLVKGIEIKASIIVLQSREQYAWMKVGISIFVG